MENPIIIFGARSQALTALEIFTSNDVIVYCFLDDDVKLHQKEWHEVVVMGATDDDGFLKLIGKKCDAFIAIENGKQREMVAEMLLERRKVVPVNAIHSRAYISKYASIGHGNLIAAGVNIGANVSVGSNCVINANACIDNEVTIDDLVQIGAGSVVNNGVKIEKGAFIGSGVTIVAGITIGKNARVGAGSVVMTNIKANQTVFGVPAVEVKN